MNDPQADACLKEKLWPHTIFQTLYGLLKKLVTQSKAQPFKILIQAIRISTTEMNSKTGRAGFTAFNFNA